MSGDINMGWWNRVTALLAGASPGDAVNKSQLDAVADASLQRSGGVMTGDINMGGKYVLNIGQSGGANDAATVGQVNAVAGRAVGGVGSAMLSYETIEVTVTLGTSPTGRWSVVAVPTGWAGRVRVVSVTETTATIHIYDTAWTPGPTPATPQPLFFWQAVAY